MKIKQVKSIIFYFVLIIILIFLVFPFIIMLTVSFKNQQESVAYPPTILPIETTFENVIDLFNPQIFPYWTFFTNSFIIAAIAGLIALVVGVYASYALSRLNFTGKKLVDQSFYFVYMFSGLLLIVPLFQVISGLGLYDTKTSMIIMMVVQTLPTVVYMLRRYFDTIPKSLEEAAIVDGLTQFQCIQKIILPLSKSGIASVYVYAFMITWNNFLFASVFLSTPEQFTLSIALNSLFSSPDYVWGRMMAASIFTAIPVLLMYAAAQYFIRKGEVDGAVKG